MSPHSSIPNPSLPKELNIHEFNNKLFQIIKSNLSFDNFLLKIADFLKSILAPSGYIFYLRIGSENFQPTLNHGIEDLFSQIKNINKTYNLPFGEVLVDLGKSSEILEIEPKDLSPYRNPTEFHHYFIPLNIGNQVISIIHIWFKTDNKEVTQLFKEAFYILQKEVNFFLKLSQTSEIAQEALNSYKYNILLDELTGDINLERIAWKVVSYSREYIGCERVSLLIKENRNKFRLGSVSGLKKVQNKSELASLLSQTVETIISKDPSLSPKLIYFKEQLEENSILKVYFQISLMNWLIILPIAKNDGEIFSALLFEGKSPIQNPTLFLEKISTLSNISPILQQAFLWKQKLYLKCIHYLALFFKRNPKNIRISNIKKTFLGILALILILLIPLPYNVSTQASLTPKNQILIPPPRIAKIQKIFIKPGDLVQENQPLIQLNSNDLIKNLQSYQQQLAEFLAQIDSANSHNNPHALHAALANSHNTQSIINQLISTLNSFAIKAPFNGTILGPISLPQLQGTLANPNTPLIHLADLNSWIIHATLREQDIPLILSTLQKKESLKASLKLIALPSDTFTLELSSLKQISFAHSSDNQSYSYFAIFNFNHSLPHNHSLKEGYKGTVLIKIGYKSIAYHLFRDFKEYIQSKVF